MAKGKMPPPRVKPWTWYKVFTTLIDDPRFLLLSIEEQRHYLLIYCCKAKGIIDRHETNKVQLLEMLAVKLRVPRNVLELAVMRMWEVGLLQHNSLQPTDWDVEQVEPASPVAARVAKHRAKKKSMSVVAETQPARLDWPACIPASDVEIIQPILLQLRDLERDGEPVAQLVLDEIAGVSCQQKIDSVPRLTITLVNQALDGRFHPEFGKPISAARRRRGEPLQLGQR